MAPRRMDHQSAQRIAKSRGQNDGFTKRAIISARNYEDTTGSGQKGSSENQGVKEEHKEAAEKTKSENGQNKRVA
ncbi:hypothetical protein F4802DRAFT_70569 [Xylaria palmicola]|nr:hypothetical protein F4802DRAFT_70569 [Xylaria palmicola]